MEIALEPEAASLFCMHLPVRKDSVNFTYGDLKSGEKYMVVDAGGISHIIDPKFEIEFSIALKTFQIFMRMYFIISI